MEKQLDCKYWDNRYINRETGWDIGHVSTPIKEYIDQLTDKDMAILIPGCGNAYEAMYLVQQGFTNITLVDISPEVVNRLAEKLHAFNGRQLKLVCADFFEMEGKFDLILEQTFFCALDPVLRVAYASKMADLLNPSRKLVGVLFNRDFDGGPPFGGKKEDYETLFSKHFHIITMDNCYNSIEPRKGNEVFINLQKR